MSNYTYTTSETTSMQMLVISREPVTGPKLLDAVYGGQVRFSKVRSNGSLRAWPVLVKGSAQRKAAESLAAQVAKSGVNKVAKAKHTSVATIRRTLTSLAFTHELETMSAKDRSALAKVATTNSKVAAAQPRTAEAPAPATPRQPKAAKAPAKSTKKAPKSEPKVEAKTEAEVAA